MKADELVALAAAHGIDIAHTVASSTNTMGDAARRARTREEIRSFMPVRETVDGKETRTRKPRYWTHAETGMGMAGCSRMPALAALYSWCGDRDEYAELHRGLTRETIRIAEKGNWAWQVEMVNGRRDYYIERLTELVLDEDACKAAFVAAPGFYAVYMGVTQRVWSRPLTGYFLTVQERYQRWLDIAKGTIGRKLRTATDDVAIA